MSRQKMWVRITECENIPLREGRSVRVGDREIAVFNLGDRFLAIDNRCPHSGGPMCDGMVSGPAVVCPLHSWKVSLHTGEVLRPTQVLSCVETFPTRVENGIVLLQISSLRAAEDAEASMVNSAEMPSEVLPEASVSAGAD